MKECPKCKAQVSDNAKFCIKCGFNIKKHEEENSKHFCPDCGTQFSGGNFCPECGYDISGELTSNPEPKKKNKKDIDFDGFGIDFDEKPKKKENKKKISFDSFGLDFEDSTKTLDEKLNEKALAEEFKYFEYKTYSKDKYIITKYIDLYETNVVIPNNVISIADKAFEGSYVTNVKLNEGIKTIGKRAFANCRYLTNINIPSSLTRVDDEAFIDCDKLNLRLPSSVVIVGKDVFNKREYKIDLNDNKLDKKTTDLLKSIESGKSDTNVKDDANLDIDELLKMIEQDNDTESPTEYEDLDDEYKDDIDDIIDELLGLCKENVEEKIDINSPEFINIMKPYKYKVHDGDVMLTSFKKPMTEIIIPNCVTSVHAGCCLTEKVMNVTKLVIPSSVRQIQKGAFSSLRKLKYLEIHNGLKIISSNAFFWAAIEDVYIPDSVKSIRDSAFCGCKNLKTASIPKGCRVADNAFPKHTKVTRR